MEIRKYITEEQYNNFFIDSLIELEFIGTSAFIYPEEEFPSNFKFLKRFQSKDNYFDSAKAKKLLKIGWSPSISRYDELISLAEEAIKVFPEDFI